MKKVCKYPISSVKKKYGLLLPRGFKFLRVSFQGEQLFMWCEVVDGAVNDEVTFETFGTNQEIPTGGKYLTSFDHGPFVFHLYQLSHQGDQ